MNQNVRQTRIIAITEEPNTETTKQENAKKALSVQEFEWTIEIKDAEDQKCKALMAKITPLNKHERRSNVGIGLAIIKELVASKSQEVIVQEASVKKDHGKKKVDS
ncbi:hypothetical protein HanRHA438_Chr07g0307131 [Helianthus annuus]|nr:hypothetical protein HanRHA438_Chr07g0307131 [Helianthus annuus]